MQLGLKVRTVHFYIFVAMWVRGVAEMSMVKVLKYLNPTTVQWRRKYSKTCIPIASMDCSN
jgi:hypothetical protein